MSSIGIWSHSALLAALLLLPPAARAQEVTSSGGTQFSLSGGVQLRASVGFSSAEPTPTDRIGFGIRRARFRADARFGPRAGMYFQVEGAGGTFSVLDFWGSYSVSPRLRFRLGRMVSAQPRSLVLTGMNQIDAADRAAIAERWAQSTIGGDGRDFGLDARYQFGQGEALLFLHNGDGAWDRSRGNFRQSISSGSATGGIERTSMAVTGAVSLRPAMAPGLEVGGFAGYNGTRNPNTQREGVGRRYVTYGAHLYHGANPGSQRLRAKMDLIGTSFEPLAGQKPQNTLGVALLLAVRPLRGAEVFVRGEALETDLNGSNDADGFFTAGATISPSARRGGAFFRERLTLAWSHFTAGTRQAKAEDLLLLQLQLAF